MATPPQIGPARVAPNRAAGGSVEKAEIVYSSSLLIHAPSFCQPLRRFWLLGGLRGERQVTQKQDHSSFHIAFFDSPRLPWSQSHSHARMRFLPPLSSESGRESIQNTRSGTPKTCTFLRSWHSNFVWRAPQNDRQNAQRRHAKMHCPPSLSSKTRCERPKQCDRGAPYTCLNRCPRRTNDAF